MYKYYEKNFGMFIAVYSFSVVVGLITSTCIVMLAR